MHARVVTAAPLTPTLVRVVLGGGDLDHFEMPEATDTYINLAFPPEGADYDGVFDPGEIRTTHPREQQPARRRYTVRSWDPASRQMTVDFVVHGDVGVAGRWASHAQPGDVLVFEGPGSGYRPDPAADWHLLVGDESALPAIAAALESLPSEARVVVRLVCDGPDHEVPLTAPDEADIGWLHRSGGPDDVDLLPDAVADLRFPVGRVQAFVHGEADEIRQVRRHLLSDRGLARSDMSCSPYWRRTMTDEAWRQIKRDYVAAMEADAS